MQRPVVAIFLPTVDLDITEYKLLCLYPMLHKAGFDPVIVVWNEEADKEVTKKGLPHLFLRVQELPKFDKIKEAQGFRGLLKGEMVSDHRDSPSWGDLLAFDDFLGAAHGYEILGLGALNPAAVITTYPGMETSTDEDEHVRMAFWRTCKAVGVPILALECQRVDAVHKISRQKADFLLTKRSYDKKLLDDLATVHFRMPPAHRYYLSIMRDPILEQFLEKEVEIRAGLKWSVGTYFLFAPFHLYYVDEFVQMLKRLGKISAQLKEANVKLVMHCGTAHRRGLKEADMIKEGLERWWSPFGDLCLMEGGGVSQWMMVAEAMLLPYLNSTLEEMAERWHIPVVRPGEEHKLVDMELTVSPIEALGWLLLAEKQKKGDKNGKGPGED